MEEEDDPLSGGPVDQDLAGRLAVQVSDDMAMEERDRVMAEEMAAAVAPVSSATGMTKSSTEMNHAAGVSIATVSVAGRQNSSSSSGDGIAIPPPPPPLPPGLVTPTYTEAMSERAGGGAAGVSPPGGEITAAAARDTISKWYTKEFEADQHTIKAFHSFENLDQESPSGLYTVETGDQLSFTYTSSKDNKEYRIHGLEILVYENGETQVDEDSVETLKKKRNRSEGYWGLESCFDDDNDSNFHP